MKNHPYPEIARELRVLAFHFAAGDVALHEDVVAALRDLVRRAENPAAAPHPPAGQWTCCTPREPHYVWLDTCPRCGARRPDEALQQKAIRVGDAHGWQGLVAEARRRAALEGVELTDATFEALREVPWIYGPRESIDATVVTSWAKAIQKVRESVPAPERR